MPSEAFQAGPVQGAVDAPAGEFQNPNDVRVQHGYALHVLNSTARGLVKAEDLLAEVCVALSGTPLGAKIAFHQRAQERLLASAKRVIWQLDE